MKKLIFAIIAASFSAGIYAQEMKKRIVIPQGKSTETHKSEVLDYVKSHRSRVLFVESFSEVINSEKTRKIIDILNKDILTYIERTDYAKHDESFVRKLKISENDLLATFNFNGDAFKYFIQIKFKDVESDAALNRLTTEDNILDEVESTTTRALYGLKHLILMKIKKYDEKLQVERFNLDGFSSRDDINDSSREDIKDLLRKDKLEIIQGTKVRNV